MLWRSRQKHIPAYAILTVLAELFSISPSFNFPLYSVHDRKGLLLPLPTHNVKAILALPALCFFLSKGAAAPQTLTSTLTIKPIPLSTVSITAPAYPHPTAYSTGHGTGRGTGTGGLHTANYTLLSITLHYRTTLQTQRTFSTVGPLSNGSSYHRPNATGIPPPISSGTGPPTPPPKHCTPKSVYCDSPTSFSLCVPGPGSSATYYFIGSVANGTVCIDGMIERANDGKCTPDGALSCGKNGQTFFFCDEGMSPPR